MKIAFTRDFRGVPAELIGQVVGANLDELVVVIRTEDDDEPTARLDIDPMTVDGPLPRPRPDAEPEQLDAVDVPILARLPPMTQTMLRRFLRRSRLQNPILTMPRQAGACAV